MIIFDTETTGLPKSSIVDLDKQPKIIEFAAIKLNDETLEEVERLEFLVNPKEKLEPIIKKITGLTDSDLENEKPFTAYYGQLAKFFLGEKYCIAHNLEFDMNLLKFELMRIGRETQFPYCPGQICTVNKTLHLNNYRLSLSKLYKYLFNQEMKEAHRAMVDVEHLTKCVKELIKREIIRIK
jgi:DNA polymerase III epsilon subunit-like protein